MKHVLLIDDDPNEHKLFDCYLRFALDDDIALHNAFTLDEGIAALQNHDICTVFLDNRLSPFVDYRQTFPVLQAMVHSTKVFVISACVDDECFRQSAGFGIAGVIDKFEVRERLEAGLLN